VSDLLGFPSLRETLGEWLTWKLDPQQVPKLPISSKINRFLTVYTTAGIGFIFFLIAVNLIFFWRLIPRLISTTVETSLTLQSVTGFQIFLLIGLLSMTYLYYVDYIFRFFRHRHVITKAIKLYQNGHKTLYTKEIFKNPQV
jgi:hypothetical protein